jgi:hypothetical protein
MQPIHHLAENQKPKEWLDGPGEKLDGIMPQLAYLGFCHGKRLAKVIPEAQL